MPDTTAEPYVIGVTGSRHHDDLNLILNSLAEAITAAPRDRNIVVRHGACPTGADAITAHLCEMQRAGRPVFPRDVIEDAMPADWDHCGAGCPDRPHRKTKKPGDIHHPGQLPDYCPKAGPRRNLAINVKIPIPAVLLAYPLPGSYGTYSCMRIAATAGIPVKVTR